MTDAKKRLLFKIDALTLVDWDSRRLTIKKKLQDRIVQVSLKYDETLALISAIKVIAKHIKDHEQELKPSDVKTFLKRLK